MKTNLQFRAIILLAAAMIMIPGTVRAQWPTTSDLSMNYGIISIDKGTLTGADLSRSYFEVQGSHTTSITGTVGPNTTTLVFSLADYPACVTGGSSLPYFEFISSVTVIPTVPYAGQLGFVVPTEALVCGPVEDPSHAYLSLISVGSAGALTFTSAPTSYMRFSVGTLVCNGPYRLLDNRVDAFATESPLIVAPFHTELFPPAGQNSFGTNPGNSWVQSDGVISIERYNTNVPAAAYCDGTLPIEWLDFYVSKSIDQVASMLYWETATEINNDHFVIEHSTDGMEFSEIGSMPGAGNSNTVLEYRYIHDDPILGVNYYRVKQVDFDGAYSYSDTKTLLFTNDPLAEIHMYPNPVRTGENITIYFPAKTDVTITIVDLFGKVVHQSAHSVGNGESVRLPSLGLSSGLYGVRIDDGFNTHSERITIVE